MNTNALVKILTSSKAIVMVAALLVVGALAYGGKVSGTEALDFAWKVLAAWLAAHSAQEGMTVLGASRVQAAQASNAAGAPAGDLPVVGMPGGTD